MVPTEAPLDERLTALLRGAGYSEGQLRLDRDVWTPKQGRVRLPLAGFARPIGPFDASTATLVGGSVNGGSAAAVLDLLTDAAISLAAPMVLLSDRDGVMVRSVAADGDALFEQRFAWLDAQRGLSKGLNPRALLSAKLGQRQASLFPVDAALLTSARDRTEGALGPRVAHLLDAAAAVLSAEPGVGGRANRHARAARLVIGALTAVVLRDKEFGGPSDLSSGALIDSAMQRHPAQFGWSQDLALWEIEILDRLVEELADVDFTFAEPVLLSRIYESRLVDDAARRQLGAHYTPPELAAQMLRYLPVEELEPDRRKVLDPTSGSGTLLLAAHDRLARLQPENLTPAESHSELVHLLHGTDIDPVAVEIANLSLLLHALPAGNGWHVAVGDALRPQPRAEFDIVVANPPWRWSNSGSHRDLAHDFLERMLRRLRPGGLLGVVLPVAWLTRNSSRASRDLVRRQCDIFEAWRLPSGTFEGADSGAAVLLARRKQGRQRVHPMLFREVADARDLHAFYQESRSERALVAGPSDEALASGPLSRWWRATEREVEFKVADYASTVSGPQPASVAEQVARGVLDAELNAEFLPEPGSIPRFARVQPEDLQPIAFPAGMQQGLQRGGAGLGRVKVLVGAAMSPNNPWRLRVALDETGALPRNTATMVIPLADLPANLEESEVLFGLLAYLGSGFASAFIADTVQTRKIGAPQLRALPAPDPATLKRLAVVGRTLSDSATRRDHEGVMQGRSVLEQIVWEWSGVPKELQHSIVARLDGVPLGKQSTKGGSDQQWVRPGFVTDTSLELGLRLAIPGVSESEDGVWAGLPAQFPGALARTGSKFTVRLGSETDLEEATFEFDEVAFLSDAEVLASIKGLASGPITGDLADQSTQWPPGCSESEPSGPNQ